MSERQAGESRTGARCIAVVNDDTDFLDLMQALLSEEGYDVHTFRERTVAYQQVRDLKPDGIILDIRMSQPEGGWELLEIFKLDPVLTTRPIIICSADSRALHERGDYLRAKGCEVLPKPFDLDDLLTLLQRLLG